MPNGHFVSAFSRLGMRSTMLACSSVVALTITPAALGQPFQALALSGSTAPGVNAAYGSFSSITPTMSSQGRVGFAGRIPSRSFERGMWYTDLRTSGQVSLFAFPPTSVSGGLPGDTWRVGDALFDASGSIVNWGAVTTNQADAITVGTPGSLMEIARADLQAPGMPNGQTFVRGNLYAFRSSQAGRVVFRAPTGNSEGVWYHDPGGATTLVLKSGDIAPDLPSARINNVMEPTVNEVGGIAFRGYLDRSVPGTTSANANTIHYGTPGQMHTLVRGGDQIGNIVFDTAVGRIPYNSKGTFAFWANTQSPVNADAIVTGPANNLQVVALRGQAGPGMEPGQTWRSSSSATFWHPVLNAQGDLAFFGSIRNASLTQEGSGVWYRSADDGVLRMITRSQLPADGLGTGILINGILNNSISLNSLGDVLFQASLTGTGVGSGNNQVIYFWSADSGLIPILRSGQELQVGSGMRTVQRFDFWGLSGGDDGSPMSFSDNREFTLNITFTDGSTGIFVTIVPAPSVMAILLCGLSVPLRRRARTNT